jgi:hypothetical protein
LLALFELYKVDAPLATKGWINRNLKAFQLKGSGISVWLPKGVKISTTFSHAVSKLQEEIKRTPIATLRAELSAVDNGIAAAKKEMMKTGMENKIYDKFAGCSPKSQVANTVICGLNPPGLSRFPLNGWATAAYRSCRPTQ